MPNWCYNSLLVTGTRRKDIDRFLKFVKERPDNGMACDEEFMPSGFSFDRVIPYPKKFAEMDREHRKFDEIFGYGKRYSDAERKRLRNVYKRKWKTDNNGFNSGGYEWCCAKWGTKWNASCVSIEEDDCRVSIIFHSAWGPPAPVIIRLIKKFPELQFSLSCEIEGDSRVFKNCIVGAKGEVVKCVT